MSTIITSTPDKVINGDAQTVSKWNAVHHPIKFGMLRNDFGVTASTVNLPLEGTQLFIKIVINTGLVIPASSEFSVEDEVYINITGAFPSSRNFVIHTITDPSTIYLLDRLANPSQITVAGTGYLNDLERKNFHLETSIYDKSSGVNVLVETTINKPNEIGAMDVDVSSYLKSLVDYVDLFDYSTLNLKDLTLGGIFNIEYREIWLNGGRATVVPGNDYYFTNSSKQIGDVYGSNMGEYVPFGNFVTGDPAKFISEFKNPTIFLNFPSSLTFIQSEELSGTNTNVHLDYFDVNSGLISSQIKALDVAEKPFVNRLKVDSVGISGKFVDYYIKDNGVEVTERKRLTIGGYDSWLFFKSNTEKFSTRLENPYLKNVDDLETAIGNIDITGKSSNPQIDFGARVPASSMDGLASLFASPKVLMLTNVDSWQVDGSKWQRVIIKNGSLPTSKSRRAFMDVKMSLLLPLRNTQKE